MLNPRRSKININNCVSVANMSLAKYRCASLQFMLLQICTSQIYKQLQANMGLLTVALQAAKAQLEVPNSADIDMVLAVSRGLEVLSRVQELLNEQDKENS